MLTGQRRLPLVEASRTWRKNARTVIALESNASVDTKFMVSTSAPSMASIQMCHLLCMALLASLIALISSIFTSIITAALHGANAHRRHRTYVKSLLTYWRC